MTICETKIFYDTEFEALHAAARKSRDWGESMIAYPCKGHWHIAHEDPEKWGKKPRRVKRDWCDVCEQPIKPLRYWKHILKERHLQKEKELA